MTATKVKLQLLISSPDITETISLEGEEFIFGRNSSSTIHLNDPAFSRSHFKINTLNQQVRVIDLSSSNGTLINDKKLAPETPENVKAGDVITINNSSVSIKILNILWPNLNPADPTLLHRSESRADDQMTGITSLDDLSEEIIHEATLRVEEIIRLANLEAQEIINQAKLESEKNTAEQKALTNLDIEKYTIEKKEQLSEELRVEKEKNLKVMQAQLDSEKIAFHAELEKYGKNIVLEHEKRKKELSLDLLGLTKKISDLEKEFSKEVQKQKNLLEEQVNLQKNELNKLIKSQEEEKLKQVQLIEAQYANKHFEFQTELDTIEKKVAASNKEFSALYDNYNSQKKMQVMTLENLVSEKNKTAEEIKSLSETLSEQKSHTAKYISESKLAISAMQSEIEKNKSLKQEADNSFKTSRNLLIEHDKKLSEIKEKIKIEESVIRQLIVQKKSDEDDLKKLIIEKTEITERLLPLKNELQELMKSNESAGRRNEELRNQHAIEVKSLNSNFLQVKKDLEAEILKQKVIEEERLQNLTRHELSQINKIKEDSLRIVLDLEDSITKELTDATSKIFATTIGMTKFREIAPDFDKSIRHSLQAGVLKLLKNELSPADPSKKKNLSSTQKSLKPVAIGMTLSALVFGGIPHVYRQVQEQNDPERLQRIADERQAAIPVKKKFTPEKVYKLGSTFVDSIIYTHDFYNIIGQEKFRSGLMKEGSVYMYKQWKINEEKSIQSYSMILSLLDTLHEKSEIIDPDYEKRDIKKMSDLEKQTLKKLESILGNGVRLEAALKFQNRFYEDYVMNVNKNSTSGVSQ